MYSGLIALVLSLLLSQTIVVIASRGCHPVSSEVCRIGEAMWWVYWAVCFLVLWPVIALTGLMLRIWQERKSKR
jgi:hypothetical protein